MKDSDMKDSDMKDSNYYDTFILIAEDCPVVAGTAPPSRSDTPTVPELQYELLSARPYGYTQMELLFEVHLRRHDIALSENNRDWLWADFFSREHPCLRASPLAKRYGWGIHFDGAGKAALCGAETDAYQHFAAGLGGSLGRLKAMRNKRRVNP